MIAELAADAVELGGVARRQHRRRLVHELQRLAQRVARRQVGGDGDRAALVEVVQLARADRLAHLDQLRQRHHGVAAATHEERSMSSGVVRPRPSLHHHVVLVGVALVARHDTAAEHGLDRARHRVDRHAHVGGAVAVHVHEDLGLVQLQVDVGLHDARVLAHLGHHALAHARHVLVAVAGHDDEVDRPLAEALAQAGRRDGKALTPGSADSLGSSSRASSGVLRRARTNRWCASRRRPGHLAAAHEGEAAVELRVLRRDAPRSRRGSAPCTPAWRRRAHARA
jgi:hypothetical protein